MLYTVIKYGSLHSSDIIHHCTASCLLDFVTSPSFYTGLNPQTVTITALININIPTENTRLTVTLSKKLKN